MLLLTRKIGESILFHCHGSMARLRLLGVSGRTPSRIDLEIPERGLESALFSVVHEQKWSFDLNGETVKVAAQVRGKKCVRFCITAPQQVKIIREELLLHENRR